MTPRRRSWLRLTLTLALGVPSAATATAAGSGGATTHPVVVTTAPHAQHVAGPAHRVPRPKPPASRAGLGAEGLPAYVGGWPRPAVVAAPAVAGIRVAAERAGRPGEPRAPPAPDGT